MRPRNCRLASVCAAWSINTHLLGALVIARGLLFRLAHLLLPTHPTTTHTHTDTPTLQASSRTLARVHTSIHAWASHQEAGHAMKPRGPPPLPTHVAVVLLQGRVDHFVEELHHTPTHPEARPAGALHTHAHPQWRYLPPPPQHTPGCRRPRVGPCPLRPWPPARKEFPPNDQDWWRPCPHTQLSEAHQVYHHSREHTSPSTPKTRNNDLIEHVLTPWRAPRETCGRCASGLCDAQERHHAHAHTHSHKGRTAKQHHCLSASLA
jgi:hypothetical protein